MKLENRIWQVLLAKDTTEEERESLLRLIETLQGPNIRRAVEVRIEEYKQEHWWKE